MYLKILESTTSLYKLYNTNIQQKIAEQKEKEKSTE